MRHVKFYGAFPCLVSNHHLLKIQIIVVILNSDLLKVRSNRVGDPTPKWLDIRLFKLTTRGKGFSGRKSIYVKALSYHYIEKKYSFLGKEVIRKSIHS